MALYISVIPSLMVSATEMLQLVYKLGFLVKGLTQLQLEEVLANCNKLLEQ